MRGRYALRPIYGTYTINPDCSGFMVLTVYHAPEFGGTHTHHVFIALAKDKSLHINFLDPGATGQGIGKPLGRGQ